MEKFSAAAEIFSSRPPYKLHIPKMCGLHFFHNFVTIEKGQNCYCNSTVMSRCSVQASRPALLKGERFGSDRHEICFRIFHRGLDQRVTLGPHRQTHRKRDSTNCFGPIVFSPLVLALSRWEPAKLLPSDCKAIGHPQVGFGWARHSTET